MEMLTLMVYAVVLFCIMYSGWLRDHGKFAKANKVKKVCEKVLMPSLLICVVGTILLLM